MRLRFVFAVLPIVGCGSSSTPTVANPPATPRMSFFITSVGLGSGANLGGLAGADRHCQTLADAAGVRGLTWRAYLSASAVAGQAAVDARDRIGTGPWYNQKLVIVAQNVADLHSDNNKLSKDNSLTETGQVVNGRTDSPNYHDMLTGSTLDGRLSADGTCDNWTSSSTGAAALGHHDRTGGGANPTSWNSAHFQSASRSRISRPQNSFMQSWDSASWEEIRRKTG